MVVIKQLMVLSGNIKKIWLYKIKIVYLHYDKIKKVI